jgi:ATP-dependent exoDNAse (exonuclease V) beta subunit
MDPNALVDQDVRHRIATDLTCRLVVDAAAGSGKTTLVIERIVSLVSVEGLSMASIAAITFTEAAAAELRLRVRATLNERAQSDERLLVAAREVDDAAICTIHSFALRILSEHWLEAGLPPRIEVLDPASEYLDHKNRWRAFTTGLLDDPEAAATMVRGFAAGLRLSQISEIGHSVADHHDRLTPAVLTSLAEERRATRDPRVDVGTIVAHLDGAMDHLVDCTDDSDKLGRHLVDVVGPALERIRPLVGSNDEATVISVLGDFKSLANSAGQKGNWKIPIADVRDACNAAETGRLDALGAVRVSVVADLAWRIASWAAESAQRRREDGRFTFHDLLVESCRLMRTNEEVRAAVRDRYRCLLIDEFQDTDPLQAELAHLLGDADGPGRQVARLFVVGDPEQSIYRFRRADVAQFEATAERMDERLELTSNFRSVPLVLEFVDAVFAGLGRAISGPATINHRSLSPVRRASEEPAGGPAVAVLGGPHSEGRARDVRVESTAQVASVVRSIVQDGWSVDDDGTSRAARYRDVAVLLPTRTALPVLERAFDGAGVPYRLEGATLVWGCQDVRDLLAVARAINDPADPVAVVAALRTPALACGDDDLVRYFHAGGSWDPRAPVADGLGADDPVTNAMAALASLHERRMWMEPSALVSLILTELHLFELALVHRRPRDHWQRLRWVLDQVRAFDETREGTLGDFLDWVDLSEEAERWTSSPGPPETDDDAVRVMTVHGAKGLEFPVVVLTGLDSPPSNLPPSLIFDAEGVPRFRFTVDFRSPPHEALGNDEKRLDRAERFRLLYVALTRARDHLVVDLNHKEKSTEAMAAILHPVCAEIPWLQRLAPVVVGEPTQGEATRAREVAPTDWWADQQRWIEQRAETLASQAHQPAWSATALSREAAAARGTRTTGAPEPRSIPTTPGHGDPETQRRIGRAVHDALSKIDLPSDGVLTDDAGMLAATAAHAQHLDDADGELVVALVRSAIGSPLVRGIAGRRHWKELPLAAPLPTEGGGNGARAVLEGFADLVGQSDSGLIVVDFKTAAGRGSSGQYLLQVAGYAYALGRATGRAIDRVVVSYLGVDGTEEDSLEGAGLAAAIAEVLGAA